MFREGQFVQNMICFFRPKSFKVCFLKFVSDIKFGLAQYMYVYTVHVRILVQNVDKQLVY